VGLLKGWDNVARLFTWLFAACVLAAPAAAQSTIYVGATTALDEGQRGNIDLEQLPVAGGVIGWRVNDSWSAELHADRAFGESRTRVFETLVHSGGTLRSEIYGRFVEQDRAGEGFSVLAVWRSRPSGRARAAVTMGFSERRFRTDSAMTISRVGPDVTLPPEHPLRQDRDETTMLRARGLTGGFMVPIALGRWTVAPEVRLTRGLWKGFISSYMHAGARVMWGF
jgi:hypothetical protein